MRPDIESALSGIAHWLGKSGTLDAGRDVLTKASVALTPEEVAEVYCYLRDHSQRFETEWRKDFTGIFPGCESTLPPVDPAALWWPRLELIIDTGDLQGLDAFISEVGFESWDFSSDPNCEIYPLESCSVDGLRFVEKARQLGHAEIADRIESLIRKIKGA